MRRVIYLLLILLSLISCSSEISKPGKESIAKILSPSSFLPNLLEADSEDGVDLTYIWTSDNTRSVSGTFLLIAEFDSFQIDGITLENGTLDYSFHGTLDGSEFSAESFTVSSENLLVKDASTAVNEITVEKESEMIEKESFAVQFDSESNGNITGITITSINIPDLSEDETRFSEEILPTEEMVKSIIAEIQKITATMGNDMDKYFTIDYSEANGEFTTNITSKKEYTDPSTGTTIFTNNGTVISSGGNENWKIHVNEYIVFMYEGKMYEMSHSFEVSAAGNYSRKAVMNGVDITKLVENAIGIYPV